MIPSFTTDADFITRCVLYNWDWITDDAEVDKDFFFPQINDNMKWIRVDGYGVFSLIKINHVMHECHTTLLPESKGKAVEIAKAALKFAFENTSALRVITAVPEYNQPALRLALKTGLVKYGGNPSSFSKGGILYAQTLLGINKGDVCQ